uniref:DNA-directed RNA polymerase III subunit RPC4-like n=1 Tax=Erigeron canadensis TaxID=72917 RepID=UPI001CB8A4BB|nr:DNA-directed RNA polymerase III subunit RPC4-like [Erigeron canadensis]
MDVDPPSSSPKKMKFKPKPPRRKTVSVLPKSELDDDENDETTKDLLRKVNERLGTRRPKVEKKSSGNVMTPNGAGSSRTLDQLKNDNSKNSSTLRESSEKSVVSSSSTATKDRDVDYMVVDDELGSPSDSDNEYKEPWDPDSYYPITLPLRPPGSGNPEVLNALEFGEEKEYDETKINSALELGLLGQEDYEKKQMIFFQFPENLPLNKQTHQVPVSLKGKEKVESSSFVKQDASNKFCGLKDLPDGHMGKMLVYKSGAIKLKLGDVIFDVHSGIPLGCKQDVAVMNTKTKNCCVLGPVDKPAVVTLDVDSILDNIDEP